MFNALLTDGLQVRFLPVNKLINSLRKIDHRLWLEAIEYARSHAMNDDALNHTVDDAVWAGAVWIHSDAQAEVIPE